MKAEPLVDYNDIVLEGDDTSVSLAQLEMSIARELTKELNKHYPWRNWAIAVDSKNGVLAVMETDISKKRGHIIHLSRPMKEIRAMMFKVGGEILERAGLPTGKIFDQDLLENLPRSVDDEVILSDLIAPEERHATDKT